MSYNTGEYRFRTVDIIAPDRETAANAVRQMEAEDWSFWDNADNEYGDCGPTEVDFVEEVTE